MPRSLDDILDDADFAYRDVPVCLKRSARSRWEEAQAKLLEMVELIEATRGADGKIMATAGRLAAKEDLARQVRALEEEIAENTVTFHVVGMPFPEYNAIMVDHPPREGNLVDRALGYNVATFHPAVVRASIRDPQMSDAQWAKLIVNLSDGDFDRLANAANDVNRRLDDGRVPFSQNASAETPGLEATLSSHDVSG